MDADVVILPYSEPNSEYLNNLQAYNQSWMTDALLDNAREVWDADNYYNLLVPFPRGSDIIFNKSVQVGTANVLQSFSGDITVPEFSLLTKITFYQTPQPIELRGGPGSNYGSRFSFRLYDKGAKADMIQKQWANGGNVAGNMCNRVSGLPMGQNAIFGPYYPLEKLFVMPPGVLNLEITDLSGITDCIIQILLSFAVPRNTMSTGTQTTTGTQ